jgi:hypothetical protein
VTATTIEPIGEFSAKAGSSSRRKADSSKRRASAKSDSTPASRFFLGKANANGAPMLEREFPTEKEVMIEALKTGQHYFVVSQWQAIPDLSKEYPLIRKEPVQRDGKSFGMAADDAVATRSS